VSPKIFYLIIMWYGSEKMSPPSKLNYIVKTPNIFGIKVGISAFWCFL